MSRPAFDYRVRATRKRDWGYTFRRWDEEQRTWIPLARFCDIDWRVLDRMAAERAGYELQLVEGERVVAEWAEGKRMPELKGAVAK